MERESNHGPTDNHHVVIDVTSSSNDSFSSASNDRSLIDLPRDQYAEHLSSIGGGTNAQPAFSSFNGGSDAQNSLLTRRANGRVRNRSPLNSGFWISVELVLTLSQVIAAVVVLSLSKNEHPRTPLFLWVVGYASGCVAVLPLLYWRYRNRNQHAERESSQSNVNDLSARASSTAGSSNRDGHNTNDSDSRGTVNIGIANPRLKAAVEYYKMATDCFFAVWFVSGIVWISNGHASATEAPNLYRVSIVFLTISCIGYAMPFILCTTICCCLPCIISVMGFREDPTQSRGATSESINSLPTYKFKVKKAKNNGRENSSSGVCDGGIILEGTEERVLSGEDAVCCICLVKYANNDELKGLPCSHFFHKECIDKWLKINASCPLCKAEVGQTIVQALTEATANLRPGALP